MPKTLRGYPGHLIVSVPTGERIAAYGLRENRTLKGPGYFGEVANSDDPDLYATELPIRSRVRDEFDRPIWIPLVVPTLTREELAHLVDGGDPTKEMVQKAVEYALWRRMNKKSPFAVLGEQVPLPHNQEEL
jgi:hypothetical protein